MGVTQVSRQGTDHRFPYLLVYEVGYSYHAPRESSHIELPPSGVRDDGDDSGNALRVPDRSICWTDG